MVRRLGIALASLLVAATGSAEAALIVNAPRPITDRVNVNLIAVADDDGTDSTAGTFGTASQQADVFSLVDVIYAQAGVDVEFAFRPGTYNSSFARTGTPGSNDPRPGSDLGAIRSAAAAAGGVLSGDPNTINVFLVSIVPGFGPLGANQSAGFASIGANGVTYYGGANLPTFASGREALASVLAHEIGHNLGLSHNTTAENLMQSGGGGEDGERLDASQIQTILASRFTVTAPATLAGDFNRDGTVDGADLLVWQRGGSPAPLDPGDLAEWKANFGEAPVGVVGTPVPEPVSFIAAPLGLLVVLRRGAFVRRAA